LLSKNASAQGMNGAVILHGNSETPQQVADLADALRRENVLVATPELAWSSRRLYDRRALDVDQEIDAAISGLRVQGAQRVYLIGQGVGANYALRFASRPGVTGIVAIAPGFAPESPFFAQSFADDLRRARELIARGRPQELLEFLDWQWGNRRSRARAPASSFLSYYDPAGPLNLSRSVEQLPNQALMLWILPAEDPGAAQRANDAYARARVSPGSRIVPINSGYVGAMGATARTIIEWMKDTVPYIRTD
jgi:hypothetical protein